MIDAISNKKIKGVKDEVFGFDKTGYLSDSEIEKLYQEKIYLTSNQEIKDKLSKSSMCDPRKSDIYFDSVEAANKGKEIAGKLNNMTKDEFMTSDYSWKWFGELPGGSLFKIINKEILKPKKGGVVKSMIKRILSLVKKFYVWVLAVIALISLFYWFQIRPANIRSYCDWETKNKFSAMSKYYADVYAACLHKKGLK